MVSQRARMAATRTPRKARRIGPGSASWACFGFFRIATPSKGENTTATIQDAISAMATTAKIEKVYSRLNSGRSRSARTPPR